jgi:hypothetical protein
MSMTEPPKMTETEIVALSRVPDGDPAQYVLNPKGRGALKARAQVTGNYRFPLCPHPDGCHFDGQCLCHVRRE